MFHSADPESVLLPSESTGHMTHNFSAVNSNKLPCVYIYHNLLFEWPKFKFKDSTSLWHIVPAINMHRLCQLQLNHLVLSKVKWISLVLCLHWVANQSRVWHDGRCVLLRLKIGPRQEDIGWRWRIHRLFFIFSWYWCSKYKDIFAKNESKPGNWCRC